MHITFHIKDHWLNNYEWYRKSKILHINHHLDNCNYGISTYLMDYIFGTKIYTVTERKDVFNGFNSTCSQRIKMFDFLG